MSVIQESFYQHKSVTTIARHLLGKALFTSIKGKVTAGIIVETEAYSHVEKGSHAYGGKMTDRNRIMFGPGGYSYVYLCYGIHHLFNVVTNEAGSADAVLVRALEPLEGGDIMIARMKTKSLKRITSGPGKLTKALGIDRSFNAKYLLDNEVWLEDHTKVSGRAIIASPRVGIDYAGEDAFLPWRFTIKDNEWISKPFPKLSEKK